MEVRIGCQENHKKESERAGDDGVHQACKTSSDCEEQIGPELMWITCKSGQSKLKGFDIPREQVKVKTNI